MKGRLIKVGFKGKVSSLLIALVVLLSSCRKELENLNKEAWTPEIGIPLFYSKVSGSDIAYDWLKASSVLIDSSQVITVIYNSRGKEINLLDEKFFDPQHNNSIYFNSITVPQTNSSTFISLGRFSDDFTMPVRDSIWNNHGNATMLPSLYNEKSLGNTLNGFSQLEEVSSIDVINGYLTVSISNSTPYTLSANFYLVDAVGNRINDSNINISSLAPGTSFSAQIRVANKKIIFPIKANFINIYASNVFSIVDTAMQGIAISLAFSPLEISSIKGRFDNLILGKSALQLASHPIFFMKILSGELVVKTNCFSCSDVSLNLTFPTVQVNGQILVISVPVNSTTRVNISNSKWQFPMPSQFPVNVSLSSNSANGTFSVNDSIEIFLSIQDYKFKMSKFLPKTTDVSLIDTLPIPFFAKTQGKVEFLEPYMEARFTNGLLSKTTASISNITNSNGDYLVSPYIGSFISLDPAPMENYTVQSFLFDVNNSNVKTFVNSQPAYAYLEHIWLLSDTIKVSEGNNFVSSQSSLALPFNGSVYGLIASDTTVLQADVLENTKDATLYITATNYFPLQTKVFVLTATLPIDTIATITIPPNTYQQNRLITEVYLNESAVQRLKAEKRIIVTAIFDSPPSTPTITIKSSQYFEVHAGVKSRTVIGY